MATSRKTRTREHVIASQSVAHVEKFIFDRGFAAERPLHDYGFDLCMTTFAPDGGAEPGNVWFQLKATDTLPVMQDGRTISFPLRWEDIALWREEPMPVILVIYDAAQEIAYWLYTQALFEADNRFQGTGSGTVTVHVSRDNILDEQTIHRFRQFKQNILDQMHGRLKHNE